MTKSLMAAAAAALLAGTSFAVLAQDQRGGSAPEAPMSRGQAGGNESRPLPNADRPAGPRVQQNQGTQHRNDSRVEERSRSEQNQRTQGPARGTTGQATQGEPNTQELREQRNQERNAQERQQPRNQPTAQDRERRDGQGRGEARGDARGPASLTTEQKTRIRTTVIQSDRAPRVSSVNFSLNVGTVVPRSVRIVAVPPMLVEVYPAWRGFMYFVVGDEVVIVDPDTLQIVAVLDV